jgi:hypothetical protein
MSVLLLSSSLIRSFNVEGKVLGRTYCPSGANVSLVIPPRWHGEDDIAVDDTSAIVVDDFGFEE